MKITRHPTQGGPDWWVVTHNLSIAGSVFLRVRPIHVFTYLAQYLPGLGNKRNSMFRYCFVLENKIYAVRHQHFEFRKAIAEWEDVLYPGIYIREYDDQQKVICVLDALLNAIYSTLEITAKINRLQYPQLPQSFREQAEKESFFSFKKWAWLPLFYDVRHELEHYATSLPQLSEQAIIFEIHRPGKKFALSEGRWKIPLNDLISFSYDLFNLLDKWALSELPKINPDTDLVTLTQTNPNMPLEHKIIKAKEIIALLKHPDQHL